MSWKREFVRERKILRNRLKETMTKFEMNHYIILPQTHIDIVHRTNTYLRGIYYLSHIMSVSGSEIDTFCQFLGASLASVGVCSVNVSQSNQFMLVNLYFSIANRQRLTMYWFSSLTFTLISNN